MSCAFWTDTITKRVQYRPQARVGSMAVRSVEPIHYSLEPAIGLLNGRIESIEAGGHGLRSLLLG
jgi:hypothetical protein